MVDLRVWILTHPASTWDVGVLNRDCLAAFAGQKLSVEVRVFSNSHLGEDALPAFRYIGAAIMAQWQAGNARLAKHLSALTLLWHLRQLAGLSASFVRLISSQHRVKVSSESARAARIAAGHVQMWQQASRDSAQLNLFLEDDVILKDPARLVELTKALLQKSKTEQFICDCSHSYSLSELGVDVKLASADLKAAGVQSFDFAFTNTLAANFVSSTLVQLTAAELRAGNCGKGLGIDLDLMRLWSVGSFKAVGMVSSKPLFEQQSGFRIQKI